MSSVLNAHVSHSYDSNPNTLRDLIVIITQVTAVTVSYDVWQLLEGPSFPLFPVTSSSLTDTDWGGGSAGVRPHRGEECLVCL